jgi:hypothetical protein
VSGDYAAIDNEIDDWAVRHSLVPFRSWAGREARFFYVSSEAGECFQISIDAPQSGRVGVRIACVEGRRDNDPRRELVVAVTEIGSALEDALKSAIEWMAPSTRHFPAKEV